MSQSETKRGRDSAGNAASNQTDDRSVRQRIEPAASAAVPSDHSFASSSLPPRLNLLGLAVVERQLILQSLDLTSFVHAASTCSRLRAESLHKEAGRILSKPSDAADQMDRVNSHRACHASPLYRAHISVSLEFPCPYGRSYAELLSKAALFRRIVYLDAENQKDPLEPDVMWTEERALQLLAQLPQVREVAVRSPGWFECPALQHALFGLPSLTRLNLPSSPVQAD